MRPHLAIFYGTLLLLALGALSPAIPGERYCAEPGVCRARSTEWPHNIYQRRCCYRWAYREHYRDSVRHYRSRIEDDVFDGDRRSWNRRDPDIETGVSCLIKPNGEPRLVRVVGPARLSEKAAIEGAVRQWQSAVAYDWAEKYMELSDARHYYWRCNRASSNESAIGKAAESVIGDGAVQKKCVVIAQPCLPAMKAGDKDER